MYILGISCFYHESAVALLKDGEIIAACAEERFSRIKHDSSFPNKAVEFCLAFAQIKPTQLDFVVFYEKPFIKFERNIISSLKYFPQSHSFFSDFIKNFLTEKLWIKSIISDNLGVDNKKILFVPQHLSHAAASYYSSPFESAAFLTLDGVGEWTTGSWGLAKNNKLYPKYELRFPHSVGLLYSTFTAFLGFQVNDGEYKVMGMAGYGKPKYINKIKKIYLQIADGSIKLNLNYFEFYKSSKRMYSDKFLKEFQGVDRFDLAASLQKCTEEIIINMLNVIYKKTKERNLVFGGGVALNSVINGKILEKTKFKNLFIYPAAGDDGASAGAALYVYNHILGHKNRQKLTNIFLGKEYKNKDIEKFLTINKILFKKKSTKQLIEYISRKLAEGKVVGWFEGRAEFSPRALGHRSILADPRHNKMRDLVNKKIKFREEFRPFAPAILEELADEYFDLNDALLTPFMLGAYKAKQITARTAPAIVHVDGTARLQIVRKNFDGNFRKLLEAFYKKTGVPILLNTSFNLKGEPIVNSPEDAYRTYTKSGLDILVMGNYIVER